MNKHPIHILFVAVIIAACLTSLTPVQAQPSLQAIRPFSLPFPTSPSLATWLVGQQHGNTSGAFNFGVYWYAAGQGLHFGIDFPAKCGTPIAAAADGIVQYVDNFGFGIRPHNLVIRHDELGYTTLYGHLLNKPSLQVGQVVKRGEVVGETGDPDVTCVSRPHLHFEIRSIDFQTAYNPATLINADWNMLATFGHFGFAGFVKDLYAPNRWQTIDSQPSVIFGGRRLNNFNASWPLPSRYGPPTNVLPATVAPLIGDQLSFKQLSVAGCCSLAWWAPNSQAVRYWDGPEGQHAVIQEHLLTGGSPAPLAVAADGVYSLPSSNGQYEAQWRERAVTIVRLADNAMVSLPTGGAFPRFSPNATRVLWQRFPGDSVPGSTPPTTEIVVANVDGSDRRFITTQSGGSVAWLDEDRLLLSVRKPNSQTTELSIHTLSSGQTEFLFSQDNLRGLSISPGGRHIMFYTAWQPNAQDNGIYLLETRTGAAPVRLPFFGGWRWRDSFSVIYIPYQPDAPMRFALYNIVDQQQIKLTNPEIASQQFSILNDDWSISPDGRYILLWNASDNALYTLDLAGEYR